MNNEDGFTSFCCKSCSTEIEASLDMIGEETECPACGAKITIPDNNESDGIVRFGPDDTSLANEQAIKSKTIRIELSDL
ncbi:MAG: hypothetical protein J6W10_05795 [Kiritimatiellae bacterium]|nr:hypothetical protein [Kiritimatiellia bacterium]